MVHWKDNNGALKETAAINMLAIMPTEVNYVEGKWLDHEEELLRRRTELLAEKKKDITMATTTDDAFAARLIDPSSSSASASPNDIVRNQIISPEIVTAADGLLSLIGGNAAVKKQAAPPQPVDVSQKTKDASKTKNKKRKSPSEEEGGSGDDDPSPTKKKRYVKLCTTEGCANKAQNGGVCIRHGAKMKQCTSEGCLNRAVKGGVCKRHGADVDRKKCTVEDCTNLAVKGGMCKRHGDCNTANFLGKIKHILCTPVTPSAVTKRKRKHYSLCSNENCNKYAQRKGVCIEHGAIFIRRRCTVEGCKNGVKKRGLCRRHGAYDGETPPS